MKFYIKQRCEIAVKITCRWYNQKNNLTLYVAREERQSGITGMIHQRKIRLATMAGRKRLQVVGQMRRRLDSKKVTLCTEKTGRAYKSMSKQGLERK